MSFLIRITSSEKCPTILSLPSTVLTANMPYVLQFTKSTLRLHFVLVAELALNSSTLL